MIIFFELSKTFSKNWCDVSIIQTGWKFSFANGFIKKIANIVCKNIRIFLWIPKENIGSLLVFHKFSLLISLEISSIVTWLKEKLDPPIVFLIAMILGRF